MHAEAGVPTRSARSTPLSDEARARLVRASRAVADAALTFALEHPGDPLRRAEVETEQTSGLAMLVIDAIPADDIGTLREFERLAEQTLFWVIVVIDPTVEATRRIHRAQRSIADVMLSLDRADLDHPATDRVGEADIEVAVGESPVRTITVAYQQSLGRFVDIGPSRRSTQG